MAQYDTSLSIPVITVLDPFTQMWQVLGLPGPIAKKTLAVSFIAVVADKFRTADLVSICPGHRGATMILVRPFDTRMQFNTCLVSANRRQVNTSR